MSTKRQRVLIAGAAGRDFHDFNVLFRNNTQVEVAAFTATQIPNIEDRRYPASLAGWQYPNGIPIYPEAQLEQLIQQQGIAQVIFSYSDVAHETVMHLASRALAAGADFRLLAPHHTMVKSICPVVSIGAVRTGCGKSQTARHIVQILYDMGLTKVVAVRHPMPYGNLAAQAVQRFATYDDLGRHNCTIEEREEYESYLERGVVVYAGVDYEAILHQAEREAEVIVWDGGNNDLPFYDPDLHIVLVDPHRPGHELRYHPGETNLRLATAVLINKVNTADPANVRLVAENVRRVNPTAVVLYAASPMTVTDPTAVAGRRVLVVEDGPTLTHGEMAYGAGVLAARQFGAAELVDPRPYAVGTLAATFQKYPHLGRGDHPLLPAMGYGAAQMADLAETINRTPTDLVLIATPIDLARLITIQHPTQRVRYELEELGEPTLTDLLHERLSLSPPI